MSAETITPAEKARLSELEQVIQKGKDTFVEVGNALGEIRDARIYRDDFKSFEEYCKTRWGFSRQNAHEMIVAAEVSGNLSGTPDTPQITSVSQARPLTLMGKRAV